MGAEEVVWLDEHKICAIKFSKYFEYIIQLEKMIDISLVTIEVMLHGFVMSNAPLTGSWLI